MGFAWRITALLLALLTGLGMPLAAQNITTHKEMETIMRENEIHAYAKPTDEELRSRLTALQYQVTQESATERPFDNEFWNQSEPGIYVDITTGQPLFSSKDKFHSTCGWPAFSQSLDQQLITEVEDLSLGRRRTEVRSTLGDSHLGHVFQNDPESPNGTRFCINSASLRFIPLSDMEREGYGYLQHLVE